MIARDVGGEVKQSGKRSCVGFVSAIARMVCVSLCGRIRACAATDFEMFHAVEATIRNFLDAIERNVQRSESA